MTCGVTLFNKSDREGENFYGMARHWLGLAAEAGQPQAKTYLGLQYLLGLGGEKDFAKAALLLEEAAGTGNESGRVLLCHRATTKAWELKKTPAGLPFIFAGLKGAVFTRP